MITSRFETTSARETVLFGKRLSRSMGPGSVVALIGGLGSGKTTFIRGLASGLRVRQQKVKSPTFVFFHIYKGKFPVYHFDLYRLEKTHELDVIGFDEFISDPKAVSLIEWAERASGHLPHDCLSIRLKDKGSNRREFSIRAKGVRAEKTLKSFVRHERISH